MALAREKVSRIASGLSFTREATSFGVLTDADFKLPAPAQRVPSRV